MILALLTGVFVERFVSDAFARPDLQPAAKVMGPADSKPEVVVRGHPLLSMTSGPLPLVVSNPFSFVQVAHYAPAELAARTYYLTDSSSARRYTDTDFFEIAVPILLREFPLKAHAVPYSTFTSTSKRFFLYASVDGLDWLSAKLGSENASFRLLGRFGPFSLFDVCVQCELADR